MKKKKGEKAASAFCCGYNCAQSVVLAYAEELKKEYGLDEKALAKLASSFGGGMGRLREVCGAVSGMFMVYGMLCGYDGPTPDMPEAEIMAEKKTRQYQIVQEMAEEFKAIHGTILCRDILQEEADGYVPAERTETYYQERPCESCVRDAAKILEKFLKN